MKDKLESATEVTINEALKRSLIDTVRSYNKNHGNTLMYDIIETLIKEDILGTNPDREDYFQLGLDLGLPIDKPHPDILAECLHQQFRLVPGSRNELQVNWFLDWMKRVLIDCNDDQGMDIIEAIYHTVHHNFTK